MAWPTSGKACREELGPGWHGVGLESRLQVRLEFGLRLGPGSYYELVLALCYGEDTHALRRLVHGDVLRIP
eukprot:614508-Pleurochrysis_carterae.AAC.1